ncbi:MAG TPA: ATP-binding protein [Vicinamibacterales bacterium]|nr:ATP-binding protein [Vicinamibacterales bacterium]
MGEIELFKRPEPSAQDVAQESLLPEPQTLEECGLRLDLIIQLVLKHLHQAGELTGSAIADRLGLVFPIVEPAIDQLKSQSLCEIVGGTNLGPPSYRYRITHVGRERAGLVLESNKYAGLAPVSVDHYRRFMEAYKSSHPLRANRRAVKDAFKHLVLSDRVLDQVGPAVNGEHSLFVYGPPGNGKTVISQAIRNLMTDDFWVPAALEVDGAIIQLYDPVNHDRLPEPDTSKMLEVPPRQDRRWIRCNRPLVTVGGELTLDALELSFNPVSGYYRAPVQLLAHGGVLVIDDFGRQRESPHALLNRWIAPLESRVDYLLLQSGQKVDLPFNVLVVFATNLKPAELVDEAFLRRIHYKVLAESPTPDDYRMIFENYCRVREIPYDPTLVDYLLTQLYPSRNIPLRGCHPRDLIDQALSLARYLEQPRRLTTYLLEAACDTYFVDETQGVSATQ